MMIMIIESFSLSSITQYKKKKKALGVLTLFNVLINFFIIAFLDTI